MKTASELLKELNSTNSSADTFETAIVNGSSLNDIDENAVSYYRKLRKLVNPLAEERAYDDTNLLLALKACEKDHFGNHILTNVGLIVFGKAMALRRLMPALRVDYIRVAGNQWVENSDTRFDYTIDMRGAIVNAFMHRSFRVNRPIQIIRYSNRIEINNPGFSLKSPEHLGEPGSELRNPFISAIFHDTNLAETKGTGIKSMRDQMKTAHLLPPTFESSRETNVFTIRLLLHHLLGEEDVKWLALFANLDLSNEQRLSLIFMRELGAIDNITYRQLNSDINTRRASLDLHRMCEMGLFELKGQGRNAYYVAGREFMLLNSRSKAEVYGGDEGMYGANGEMCKAEDLPKELKERVEKTGKRITSKEMESLILDLCSYQPLALSEIAFLLRRSKVSLRNHYLNPLMGKGELFYTIPEMIKHPNQKYTTEKK